MSTESRARIRADLVQYAHDDRSSAPRWVVPAGAAAAVALVAGLAFWAISPGTDDRGLPVTGGGSTAPPTPGGSDTTAVPTPTPSLPTSVPSTSFSTPASGEPVEVGTGSCEQEMDYVLKGAQPAVHVDESATFYVKGNRFVLCDTLGGVTTVHRPLSLVARIKDVSTYAVSSVVDGKQIVRVAGGVVPDGLVSYDVEYAFPDGHTERATTVSDDAGRSWWYVAYSYADPAGNELEQPPIEVTVSLSGTQYTLPLQWGVDTCAQANHGC
jgi:hypothetical protein